PAPEHETAAAEQRRPVADQDRVVDLRHHEAAGRRPEDQVADGRRIMPAPGEFSLGNDLRDDEAEQYREPEAGDLQLPDREFERFVNDHAERSPGMGSDACASRSSGARSPRSRWNRPARAIIAALSVASRGD